jgi:hypothetical protein
VPLHPIEGGSDLDATRGHFLQQFSEFVSVQRASNLSHRRLDSRTARSTVRQATVVLRSQTPRRPTPHRSRYATGRDQQVTGGSILPPRSGYQVVEHRPQ